MSAQVEQSFRFPLMCVGVLACVAIVSMTSLRLEDLLVPSSPSSLDLEPIVLSSLPPSTLAPSSSAVSSALSSSPSAAPSTSTLALLSGSIPRESGETPYNGPRFHTSKARMLAAGLKSSWNFTWIAGWPVCEYRTLCMYNSQPQSKSNGFKGGLFGKSRPPANVGQLAHYKAQDCVPREAHKGRNYDEGVGEDYQSLADFPTQEDGVVWLPGTTLVIDTFLTKVGNGQVFLADRLQGHFGHVVGRALQSHWILEAAPPDRVFWFRQSRFPSSRRSPREALTEIVLKLMGPKYSARNASVYGRPDLHENWKWACMENALDVRGVFERTFAGLQDLRRWAAFRAEWNPSGRVGGEPKCPRPHIVLLQRQEGKGDRSVSFTRSTTHVDHACASRSIREYQPLNAALRELGICTYRNVSLGGGTSLAEQAGLFENYTLLISAHSSQLRNVIWAHPLSATLEIRPNFEKDKEWYRQLSPFCVAGLCPSIYATTASHSAKSGLTGPWGPLDINAELFRKHLKSLIERQKQAWIEAGCDLMGFHKGEPCRE